MAHLDSNTRTNEEQIFAVMRYALRGGFRDGSEPCDARPGGPETARQGKPEARAETDVPERASSPADVVLITGSSGFIGRALAARLKARYRIVGLDVFAPPNSDIVTVKVDLTSSADIQRAMGEVAATCGKRIASVIHLAAYYDLSGEPNPKYQPVTVEGTRQLLRALHSRFAVEQFV